MAAQSSLYNEDRNLLRIKEQERRNHEAVQERCPFQDQAPLFPEPYKRSRGDELSSRIQSMLGNYEEVKELIGAERNQNFIGIPKSALPVSTQGKSDRFNSFNSGAHRPVGASNSSIVPSGQRNRHYPGPEPVTRHLGKSQSCAQGNLKNNTRKEQPGIKAMDKIGRRVQDFSIEQLASPSSISALSPLLSSLSPPGEPLSPLHSTHDMDSMPQGSHSHENVYNHVKSSPSPSDTGKKDGPASVTNLIPSTQGFPTSLTSKTNVMPQKPTAYVRPMDGLDQAPNQSPDLKPLQEDYNEDSFGTFADIKGKERYSKLEMHSVPCETITNDAHCVEEILKEMTHSWPPPLTAIHTPSTAEPTKFPFPTKESQQVPSVKVNQKQYDTSSRVLPSPQEGTSNLEDDLHISESDDSDEEEVSEKPPSSSASSSILQSQAGSVVSAHSGSVNSDSGESDSSSDSDSEGSSSDSEVKVPSRPASPEPDPPTNIWQLQNWLKTPASTENHSTDDHESQSQWLDNKGQESLLPPPHDSPKTIESHPKKATWTSQEEIQNKMAHPNFLASREAGIPRQTVGIKQPRKPTKAFHQEEPKAGHTGLTVESEPAPYRPRDQPSKEKPTVKTKGKPKSNDFKEPKASIVHTVEKKHKSSHSSSKKCSNFQTDKKHTDYYIQEPSPSSKEKRQRKANHRTNIHHPAVVVREDFHRDKVLLPIGDNRLLPPPSRNIHRPQNLIVKIDLSMLLRVPGAHGKLSQPKGHKEMRQESHSRKKEGSEKKTGQNHSKEHSKRKQAEDREKNEAQKKIKMDAGKKSSSSHKEFSTKVPKISSESIHKEHLQPKQMSPTQHILKKAEKVAHKRRPSESSTCSQQSTTSIGKSNHKDPSSSKHRKVEEKESKHVKNCKGSTENNANPFPVPSLPNGNAKLTRPQLKFEEKLHSPEHYMKEAKKLKHKADAMSDKIGKAFNYLDAAMFFIECGISMESDVQAPKSAYTMFAETIDLIKFIMKLKNFADSSAPLYEQAFAILCMRCQSLLYMAMFRYKKETAVKYSRTLGEHFKSSCRAAQAPSPCVVRMSGTPSPLSPTPSPASSGGSQPGSIASNSGSQNSSVTIPQMIHQIASSYVNITSYFLYAFDIWEQADLLSKKNKEFFTDLSAVVCPLALNSTMNELVHYTRQGLHWLRLETSMILDGAGGHIQAL